jgi:hypothetical protein
VKFEFDADDMNIELKPHIGVTTNQAGSFKVRLPQDIIFLNGKQVGYVGTEEGGRINLILSDLPAEILPILKEKIDAIRGSETISIAQVTKLEDNNVVVSDTAGESTLADEDL